MLVLSRNPGEVIRIGDSIVVTLLAVGRGGVRIGIEAPRNVPIRRGELSRQVEHENDTAAPCRPAEDS